jgi:hypothetical protein
MPCSAPHRASAARFEQPPAGARQGILLVYMPTLIVPTVEVCALSATRPTYLPTCSSWAKSVLLTCHTHCKENDRVRHLHFAWHCQYVRREHGFRENRESQKIKFHSGPVFHATYDTHKTRPTYTTVQMSKSAATNVSVRQKTFWRHSTKFKFIHTLDDTNTHETYVPRLLSTIVNNLVYICYKML